MLVVVSHNSLFLPDAWSAHIPGALGVDIFFIISGFIMTFITHRAMDTPVQFIAKRFFRIWPVLFVTWLISYLFVYPEKAFQEMAGALYFGLLDYSLAAPTFGYSMLGPPWTLSYEVMFYLIFSLAMGISYRYRSAVCAFILVACSVGFQLYYNKHFDFSSQASPDLTVIHGWQAWIKILSNTIFFEFIAGMALAEVALSEKLPALTSFERNVMVLLLALALVLASVIGPQLLGLSGGFWLASVCMLAVITLSYRTGPRSIRAFIFLGDISYSLYLVHHPVMLFLARVIPEEAPPAERTGMFLLSITASIVIASALFKWIEKPSIRAGKKIASALARRPMSYTN